LILVYNYYIYIYIYIYIFIYRESLFNSSEDGFDDVQGYASCASLV